MQREHNMSSKSSKQPPAKLILTIIIVIIAAYFGIDLVDLDSANQPSNTRTDQSTTTQPETSNAWSSGSGSIAESQRDLVALIQAERSGQMIEFQARVVKTLADDNDGDRHQRFILAVDCSPSPADTVLVAHNIDLAPKVPVEAGDTIRIFGQYEWNERGGVVHWTHHDPGGRHTDGWIELDDKRYD